MVTLQSGVHGWAERRGTSHVRAARVGAAVTVQAAARGYQARRAAATLRRALLEDAAAGRVQRGVRRWLAARGARRAAAAVAVQRRVRGMAVR